MESAKATIRNVSHERRAEAIRAGFAWFRVNDLRVRWGVSRQCLYNWRRAGILPEPVRLGPNMVAWPADVIFEFEKTRVSDR